MYPRPQALAICTVLLACTPPPDITDAVADHMDQLSCPSEIPTGPCSGTITCEYGQSSMCPGMTGPVTTCHCNLGTWTCFDIPYDCADIPMLDKLSCDDSGLTEDYGPETHSDLGSDATVDTGSQSTPGLSTLCGTDLPIPGTPCTEEGTSRCTNLDATALFLRFGHLRFDGWICSRPHLVVCRASEAGTLQWQTEDCPVHETSSSCLAQFGGVSSCQEGPRGAKCCLAVCPDPSGLLYTPVLCDPRDRGLKTCSGIRIHECGYRDDVADDPVLAEQMDEAYAECGQYCTDCTYWYVERYCDPIECPRFFGEIYQDPQCIEDEAGVHCAGEEACQYR